MCRYIGNFFRVQSRRNELLNLSRQGDLVAYDELRDLVERALTFSILAIQNPVRSQEKMYEETYSGILPVSMNRHVFARAMANDWMCKHFRLNLLDDASGRTFADAATKCFGLGPAKATYAAGMLAFDDAGCIDRWMARQYGLPEKFATMKAYREAYATIGWGHTLDQWSDFLSVEDFRRDQHDVFFRSVLGSAAVTA